MTPELGRPAGEQERRAAVSVGHEHDRHRGRPQRWIGNRLSVEAAELRAEALAERLIVGG